MAETIKETILPGTYIEVRADFSELLNDYSQMFSEHGSFTLRKDEKISQRCREEGVSDKPGVYLIYGLHRSEHKLLYVGKAGTLQQDGTFKKQKLLGRLNAVQDGIPRQRFFQEQIEHLDLDALVFNWFVTFSQQVRVIPAKAELDLLQAYFDEYHKLPLWHKTI